MASIDEYSSDGSQSDREIQTSPRQRRSSISSNDEDHDHDHQVAMQTIEAIRDRLNDSDNPESEDGDLGSEPDDQNPAPRDINTPRGRPRRPRHSDSSDDDPDDSDSSGDEPILRDQYEITGSSETSKISCDRKVIEQLVTVHDVREFLRAYAIQRLLTIKSISRDYNRGLVPHPHRNHPTIGSIGNSYFCTWELTPGKPCNRACARSETPNDRHLCQICQLDPEVQVNLGNPPNNELIEFTKTEPYRWSDYCCYPSCRQGTSSSNLKFCDKHFMRIDVLIQGFKLTAAEISRYRVRNLHSQEELRSADGVNLHVFDHVGLDFTNTTFLVVHGQPKTVGTGRIHGLQALTCYSQVIRGVFPTLRSLNIYSELKQRSFIAAPNLEWLGISAQNAPYLAADVPKLDEKIGIVQEIRANYATLLHATQVIQVAMVKWIRRHRMQKLQKILDWEYVLGVPYNHKEVPKFVPWLYQVETLKERKESYYGSALENLGSQWVVRSHRFADVAIEVIRQLKQSRY